MYAVIVECLLWTHWIVSAAPRGIVLLALAGCVAPPDCPAPPPPVATPPVATPLAADRTAEAGTLPAGMPLRDDMRLRPLDGRRYRIDDATLLDLLVLGQAGQLPVEVADGSRGAVVRAAAPGSVLALAGLREGDRIVSVAGRLLDGDWLVAARRRWHQRGELVVVVERDGAELTYRYEGRRRRAPTTPEPTPDEIRSGIRRVDAHHYEVDGGVLEWILAHQAEVMRSARFIPQQDGGAVVGLRLSAIREGSWLARLGLRDGDVLRTINGASLTSPDEALEAYARLRSTSELVVGLDRLGEPLSIRYAIKRPSSSTE